MKDKQYKQSLTPQTAAEGINAANENAQDLLSDVELLFENGKYERATALAILAIEEAGKPAILRSILVEDDPKAIKKAWQNYRKHTAKNAMWIMPDLFSKGARKLFDFEPMFKETSDHPQMLDNLKQLTFYTDAFSNCKWSLPKNVVDKELANKIIGIAKMFCSKEQPACTKQEMELWIKHIKPVWKKDTLLMKQALVNFYQEAELSGIYKEGSAKAMGDFAL